MKPKKPVILYEEYMIPTYKCPYCELTFDDESINKHMDICYMYVRKTAKENYSKAAKIRERGKRNQ